MWKNKVRALPESASLSVFQKFKFYILKAEGTQFVDRGKSLLGLKQVARHTSCWFISFGQITSPLEKEKRERIVHFQLALMLGFVYFCCSL